MDLETTAIACVLSLIILVAGFLVRMVRKRKRVERLRDRNYFKRLDAK